jgi:4-hydroxy-2-oxoheptanedioate aldolase
VRDAARVVHHKGGAVELPVNRFKRGLLAGSPQIGLWCSLSSHYVLESIASAGFDWLLLDMEHSPNDLPMVLTQLQAVACYPVSPIVRPPWNDMVSTKRLLDIGAQTLLFPYVQNADEARAAVASVRYPPAGMRGVALATRANRFGRVKDYARRAQDELCVLVQAETREALDRLENIAGVEGVDGVFIGPADLHASLGFPGETANPAVLPIIDEAIRRIRKRGKAPGILTSDEMLARRYLELGALFVAVGSDMGLLARGADALAAKYKG